ncbi:hypothetical protein, partial [Haliangium sp. UPWRP_2]|uniref:hypothetical protein n=1 Tax=Haliangium sp. UPWRP_2 TaxID=1931276 RepID=UPI001304A667
MPRFDGQNQLGLLTDLAALRAVGNLPLGLAEVGLSVGALFDPHAGYGTPELGARVGLHLPFMPETKIFAEGLARGFGVWNRSDEPLPGALAPGRPVVPGGALAFGLVTRPRRQVDFALIVHVGFGDVAPFFLTVRGPLDFSIGEGYPYPQSLVVDIIREAGEWIAEQHRKLPEPLKQTCMLYRRDGQPIATLGHLADDGEHCELRGQRFRIGETFYPDPVHRQVCLDPEAVRCVGAQSVVDVRSEALGADVTADLLAPTNQGTQSGLGGIPTAKRLDPALLQRLLSQGALGPIRGELDDRCILNEGTQQVSPIGHVSHDGKHCDIERDVVDKRTGKKLRTQLQKIPIGQPVYRDPSTGRVCLTQNTKSKKDCPALLDVEHNRTMSSGTRAGYHGALALVDWAQAKVDTAKNAANLLTHPVELTTAALKAKEHAEQAAKKAVETLKDPSRAQQAAHEAWVSTVDAALSFYNQPLEKKGDALVEGAVKGGLELGVIALTGAVGEGGAELNAAKDLEHAANKGAQVAEKLEQAAGPYS